MIPYGRHCIEEDDIEAIVSVLKSDDNISDGPRSLELEQNLSEYVGAKYAVVVSSGTAALHAACYVAGLKAGDEVITSPNTFVSTAEAIMYCGAKPVFADIDAMTHNIKPESVADHITERTKAILPVDYAGQPCDLDEIRDIAQKHNLLLIEDGAEALGSEYRGRKIGSISDMTIFSFHAVKNITTCEGGAIVTDNKEYYDKLKKFRAYGIDKTIKIDDEPWLSVQTGFGYNYRLSEIQCALGISQLKKLNRFIARRTEIADRYFERLANVSNLKLPYIKSCNKTNWYMFVIQLEGIDRRVVWEGLKNSGIMAGVSFYPVYKNQYYQEAGYSNVYCKESERFYRTALSLPCFPKLKDDDVDRVIDTLITICDKYR